MKTSKIELFRSPKNKQYYIRFRARNGEIILQSEGYKKKSEAKRLPSRIANILQSNADFMGLSIIQDLTTKNNS